MLAAFAAVGTLVEAELGLHPAATGAGFRRRESARCREELAAASLCLVGELAGEFAPALVGDSASKVAVAHQVLGGERLDHDGGVAVGEATAEDVEIVGPLAAHSGMETTDLCLGVAPPGRLFVASPAPLVPAGGAALDPPQ
ncbi:MAG TPA: hypothetical protein VGL92_14645 [Acidimicrobiia bacterium]